MTWTEVEARLAALPPEEAVMVALRAARRVVPAAAVDAGHYGPEAFDWMNALDRGLQVGELGVTGFRLSAAAEVARCVAQALARANRERGPGPNREAAEMACAAVALALDAARTPARTAVLAMQSIRAACGGGEPTADVVADLADGGAGPLWLAGEPATSAAAWAALAASGAAGEVV